MTKFIFSYGVGCVEKYYIIPYILHYVSVRCRENLDVDVSITDDMYFCDVKLTTTGDDAI